MVIGKLSRIEGIVNMIGKKQCLPPVNFKIAQDGHKLGHTKVLVVRVHSHLGKQFCLLFFYHKLIGSKKKNCH